MAHIKTIILLGAATLCCLPGLARAQSADERLRAIYTEEWKWRLEQFPGLEGVEKPVPDRLPRVDPATQVMRLRYWQDVLHKLDDVPRAQLSPEEQINYDVYRPEIENFVADQKFRDYEMPANSDSAFWTDLGYTARRPFKTLTDYKNWIAQMRDIPRYFREQIANMRAGLARGFTPPRLTLQGREKSIATIAEGKPEDNLLYTPFREPMVGVQPSDQDKLKSEAAKVIREIVQPAYADLLKFFRGRICAAHPHDAGGRSAAGRENVLSPENSRVYHARSLARRNSPDRSRGGCQITSADDRRDARIRVQRRVSGIRAVLA